MKKIVLATLAIAIFANAAARTSKEVRDEISELNKKVETQRKEQSELEKKPAVSYTKEHSRAGNIIKGMGKKMEINRQFECGYRKGVYHERRWNRNNGWHHAVCNKCRPKYYEWLEYKKQIPETEKRVARIEEIKKETGKLKEKISELSKERSELLREEKKEKAATQRH